LNLVGILTPGPRLAALTGNRVLYRDGVPIALLAAGAVQFLETLDAASEWAAHKALLRGTQPAPSIAPPAQPRVPSGETDRRALQRLAVHPVRQDFPARIVLRGELAAAGMEHIAAGLGRQRLLQEPAGRGIARVHQPRRHLEILARLLLVPGAGADGQPLQPEAVVAFRVAYVAAGMAVALLQEDRLDADLEELVVERRRRAQGGLRGEGYRRHGSSQDESRSRRRHVNPPVAFFISQRNGMLI